ncbi:hypothetical protein FIBSPDRAFT_731614 [Athelia psychrophila]|uniref:Uncharacterized protein n=1 Tax=Athelia psychrophila TaxID=1759441 RepID=A0A166QCU9_9AGAM|nr:hypothetical protein FIBSPDRAFT_731614 [Fibularhizoctonia sp. CBS 109695]
MCRTKNPYYKTPIPGRPQHLGPRDLSRAENFITSGKAWDGSQLRREFFPHVSEHTFRRNLCEIGLHGQVCREKPLLMETHKGK